MITSRFPGQPNLNMIILAGQEVPRDVALTIFGYCTPQTLGRLAQCSRGMNAMLGSPLFKRTSECSMLPCFWDTHSGTLKKIANFIHQGQIFTARELLNDSQLDPAKVVPIIDGLGTGSKLSLFLYNFFTKQSPINSIDTFQLAFNEVLKEVGNRQALMHRSNHFGTFGYITSFDDREILYLKAIISNNPPEYCTDSEKTIIEIYEKTAQVHYHPLLLDRARSTVKRNTQVLALICLLLTALAVMVTVILVTIL